MAKSRRSTRTRRTRPPEPTFELPSLNKEAVAVLLLVVAAATLVSLLFPAPLTRDWSNLVWEWFGIGSYILPVLIGVFGLGLLWTRVDEEYQLRASEVVGWVLAFLFLLTFGHDVGVLFDQANMLMGLAGQSVADALSMGLSPVGAGLAILALGVAGAMLSLHIGPADLWIGITAAYEALSLRIKDRLFPEFTINRPQSYSPAPKLPIPALPRNGHPKPAATPPPVKPPASSDTARSIRPTASRTWQLPPNVVLEAQSGCGELSQADIRQKVAIIEKSLIDLGIQAHVVEVNPGPTVTQFGLEPGYRERYDRNHELVRRERVRVAEIMNVANDLALALAAPSIRIEAPVPGRPVVGLEVPNSAPTVVSLRGIIETSNFQRVKAKSKLAIALGQAVSGQPIVGDLGKMPHLLIAGATGSGKSVCINSIVASLLLHCTPDELRLLMIDPKRVELTAYNDIPHLLTPVVVDVSRACGVLQLMLREMDDRYKKFEEAGTKDLDRYNKSASKEGHKPLPYIVVIIDELADLMMTAPDEIEPTLCRLAQLARATGIHLVVATQRPSVDVVTGLIKANIPTRIAFAVSSMVDSRTILDMPGAEKLLGRGDMLYAPTDAPKPYRCQGTYVSDDEIDKVVSFWKAQGPVNYVEAFNNAVAESEQEDRGDEMYEKAVELAQQHSRISTSLLQRRLRIGYSRAARLIDMMEEAEIVGPSEGGGKSREVLIARPTSADGRDITADSMIAEEDGE